ncbi:MAG: VPLPA-CTERM sorting domain-containing protein [Pseudomonadota bacterium]
MALAVTPALATTVTFDVTVTTSVDDDDPSTPAADFFDLPDVGTTGTVTISVPALVLGSTTPIPFADGVGNIVPASANASIGSVSAALEPNPSTFADPGGLVGFGDGLLAVGNGSLALLDVSFPQPPGAVTTYAGGFVVFAPLTGATPTTLGDLAAILLDPAATATFSFSGDTVNSLDTEFLASGPRQVVIPLPATAWLLLSGIGAVAALRCRRG